MRKSNRVIGACTAVAMILAVPAMAQTAATSSGTGLTPSGPAGTVNIGGLYVSSLTLGIAALAAIAIAVAVSSNGSNGGPTPAPTTTSTSA